MVSNIFGPIPLTPDSSPLFNDVQSVRKLSIRRRFVIRVIGTHLPNKCTNRQPHAF